MITNFFLLLIKHSKHFLVVKMLLIFYDPPKIAITHFINYQTYSFSLHLSYRNPSFLHINYYSNNLHNSFNNLQQFVEAHHTSMNQDYLHFLKK